MKKVRINKNKKIDRFSGLIDRNYLIIIGIFFILVTIKVVMSSGFYSPFIIPDEVSYDKQAQHLLEGHLDPINPGYPAILSLAYIMSSDKSVIYHIMLFISIIISASIIFPAYFFLKRYCSNTISIVGSVAVATLTSINAFSFTIMTESLFTPLLLFSVWFMINSYEKDDKKWQVLASLSVIYLYVTRSDGLAMILGFIAAFIYYIVVNHKKDSIVQLITKKTVLLATFIMALSAWLLISHMANPSIAYGSPYDASAISGHVTDTVKSGQNLILGIKLFADEFIYLYLCSYFILAIIIFYYIINYKKIPKNDPLTISNVYSLISLIMLLLAFVAFRFYASDREGFVIIGRYVEPFIPLVLVLGIICINNIKKLEDKYIYYFVVLFIVLLVISLFVMEIDLSIIQCFGHYANNFSIYYLEPLYQITFPEVFVSIYAMAFLVLICLSLKNKRFINGLLTLVILSSLVPTLSLYSIDLDNSVFRKDNNIDVYLNTYTNTKSELYIDTNMSALEQKAGVNVYSFWNKGETGYVYGDSKNLASLLKNNNTYLISVNQLPYREITNDDIFKLYQL